MTAKQVTKLWTPHDTIGWTVPFSSLSFKFLAGFHIMLKLD